MIQKTKQRWRHFRRNLSNTITYFRLTLEGNRIEKLTDFKKCDRPVLLLHGFGATRRTVAILEQRLRRDGFCVFGLNLGGLFDTFNTRSIETLAKLVDGKVERFCRRHRFKKISIIGHSKGGLIGHYYVKKLRGTKRVRVLITLGTPHNGNPWAFFGVLSPLVFFARSLRQFTPMSSFIRKLSEGSFPKNVRLVSIYSKEDRICPYKSAMLDIPSKAKHIKNIEIKGMSHADFVMRKTPYSAIKRELLA